MSDGLLHVLSIVSNRIICHRVTQTSVRRTSQFEKSGNENCTVKTKDPRRRWSVRSAFCYTVTRKANGSIFYRTRVMRSKFTLWEYAFWTFTAPVTLTLTRWPSYANLTRIARR